MKTKTDPPRRMRSSRQRRRPREQQRPRRTLRRPRSDRGREAEERAALGPLRGSSWEPLGDRIGSGSTSGGGGDGSCGDAVGWTPLQTGVEGREVGHETRVSVGGAFSAAFCPSSCSDGHETCKTEHMFSCHHRYCYRCRRSNRQYGHHRK